jgi:hypothetical protein
MKTMRDKLSRASVVGMMFGLIVCLQPAATAQDNDSLFVGRPVPVASVTRVVKRRRRVGRNRKPVVRTPLLAIQLRLYKLKDDGTPVETNPLSQFYADDRLRLGVRANQRGYLTIIQQREREQDGQILFPTSRLNDGGNYVEANKEFVVPSNCPADLRAFDCAYIVPPGAGRALFTFIFSRDAIIDLPESATTSSGMIQAKVIKDLEQESAQQLNITTGTQTSPYAILVINTNRKDNEEIVTRRGILVAGGEPEASPVPTTAPTDTPTRYNVNDSSSPTPINSNVLVTSEERGRDWSSIILIALGAVGVAGVLIALFYIVRGGRFGR